MHGLFRECAAAHPQRTALLWDGGEMSYAELDARSEALAAALIERGVLPEQIVALCLPRSAAAIVSMLGVLKAGAAYLPLDPEHPDARLAFLLADAQVGLVVSDAAHAARMRRLAPQVLVAQLGAIQVSTSAALPEQTTAVGRAYVMYTSGSTGEPKGVEIEHRSIVRLVGAVDYVQLDASTCFLHAAPLGFDASTLEIWGPLLNGGRCAIFAAPLPHARALATAIAAHAVTSAWLTAALFNAVIDEDPGALRGLRELLIGGEALSPSHVRRALAALPATQLVNGYGPTECTTFTTTYAIPRDLPPDASSIPIGRAIADTHVQVLDAARNPVPEGETGELYIGGRGLARGYLARPALTAECFVEDPLRPGERLYRSGDLVRWCAADVLQYVGRVDQQLKVRGYRIEPGEIQARLNALPGVRASAVVARGNTGESKRLVAYLVATDGAFDIAGVRAALATELPEWMLPAEFVRLDALPLTANGKLDRAALPAPTRERPPLRQALRLPAGQREVAICAAFAAVLDLSQVGADDGFFELGGDSLRALRVLARLRAAGIGDIAPALLFEHPSAAALALALDAAPRPLPARGPRRGTDPGEPIAIVGMAGRFPGATDIEAFWRNLCEGRESITFFEEDALDAAVPAALRADPAYVRARGVIDDVECFDAAFFGVSPLEAQLMDPQQRHFLEVAWLALEHAGHVPEQLAGPVGVFGGMYNASYYQRHVLARPDLIARLGELNTMLANEKDYLTSRTAHKLGLNGPAVSVNTACSTSLVATAMAIDSLRAGACDLALAGGVAITCPPRSGYLYQEGAMASPDGHTRAFDARAAGTVFSDGVAVVALRRLSDAIADGDTVYAVIRAAAVNNDGAERASFTAPSPAGQAAVIAAAHDAAGIDARSISYVEAHGTATPIGDPIEIEGLTRAFRRSGADTGYCAIGSLKSNVGHLVIAAGAASLIKTALALHRRILPPTIGFEQPNPQIDFAATPFVPQARLAPWPQGAGPRRAGVSSFGFGGTNAHAVLEEFPRTAVAAAARNMQLIVLCARTREALTESAARLADHLLDSRDGGGAQQSLADVAHTLRAGRRRFAQRRFVVAASHADAAARLRDPSASRADIGAAPKLVFAFPGQGSQYAAMGSGLYASEPVFREACERCFTILAPLLGEDPRALLYADRAEALVATRITQPAVFVLEYALAQLWLHWGLKPTALIGHSVGEFVCAVLAGVMPLADALALVAERGRLMQSMPAGSMLSVRLPAAAMASRLPVSVSIAAENAPALCVVAGPTCDIEALQEQLAREHVATKRLVTSHAFHSPMMDPVVEPLAAALARISLHAPAIPIVSTVSADWLDAAQAISPRYWAEHLRRPVRFGPALAKALAGGDALMLEIGPRATLSALARQVVEGKHTRPLAVASLADTPEGEPEAVAAALGQLWTLGIEPDWKAYRAGQARQRVALPGYPFARQRHWIDATAAHVALGIAAPAAAVERAPDASPAPVAATVAQDSTARLRALVEEVSGTEIAPADVDTPWLELGLDSLALTQLALAVQRAFGVKVSFRQIMERYASVASLAELLAPTGFTATPQTPANAADTQDSLPAATDNPDPSAQPLRYDVKTAFGAIARIHTRADQLTPQQRARLNALIARYTARTGRSKAYTSEHRAQMADPRVVNGFRPLTKELTYQLVIERSRGSRMWDLDGNEYVDVLSGFGMSLFGWQPDFLRETLHAQIERGYEIGPQHVLAGETAALFCEVTGAARAAFCNTGSEAVMGTMRIARTVTGRSLIAIFAGAYHGIFDEVIVRGAKNQRSIPAAPGIMPSATQNVIVLDYGTPESLDILRKRAHELAAVLVEPVQSRRPDFQPVEFLREVRELTRASGTLLIFDEVVTGFRAHPRGVQGLFGIDADLASYGKVVGGGFSIGVIAGKREFMDALDGGHWQYGDASIPSVGVTYFAGTFVRHPLALAASKAVLVHLRDAGPALQQKLTARTAAMVARINAQMDALGAPFRLKTYASWWRNNFTEDLPYGDLIYTMLRDRGIHILDNFPCFLTTAHTEADIERIIAAYREAAAEMIASGFFPARHAEAALEGGGRVVPSTEPQREVWLADRFGTEASLAYNESVSLHLRGALDTHALRAALRALPQRHDALRATFTDDGTMLQVPAITADIDVPLHDAAGAADPQAFVEEIADRHVREPFDLARGPLLRADLVRLADEHHVLVLSGHHIVLDGWSFGVVVRDLAALYRALREPAAALPPAPSFADYALAESTPDDAAQREASLHWWTHRFADGVPVLELPTDRPRPRQRSTTSARCDHLLPPELLAALRKLGARHGASLSATMLAGFAALLHRLTGQDDLVVGLPAAAQAANGHGALVGHCVHMLPLRLAPTGAARFGEFIGHARQVLLDATEHQSITFGKLLQALAIAREPSRLPLISVIFNIDQALTGDAESIPGLVLDLSANPRVSETFELFINAVDTGVAGLRLECQYSTALFDAQTIARWLGGLQRLLEGAVHDAQCTLARLPLLLETDRALLDTWNRNTRDFPRATRIESLLLAHADRTPQRIAVHAGTDRLSYAALAQRSAAVAASLAAAAVRCRDRVGLLLDRDVHLLPGLLGALRAGACYVPLDPAFPAERLRFMVADAQLAAILCSRAQLALAQDMAAGLPIVVVDADVDPSRSMAVPAHTGDAHDPAYMIYTSGSTGRPKGVLVPHCAVLNFLASMQCEPGMGAGDRMLALTTLSFDIAVLELFLPLLCGSEVRIASRADSTDPQPLRQLVESYAPTRLQATPSAWRMLLDSGWSGAPDLVALVGGEALPPDLADALQARCMAVWNLYGPTETTVWSTAWPVANNVRGIAVGRPIANTTIWVLDAEQQSCPIGVAGEIWIGGAGVALGYHRRAELTDERFQALAVADGARCYRTGDRGRWRNDGVLEHLGRLDDQIKLRGYRIELGEIEATARRQPGVTDAVAVVRELRPGDSRLLLYVVLDAATALDEPALRSGLRRELPDYMVPQHLLAIAAVPRLPNGKTDRNRLPLPAAVSATAPTPTPTLVTPHDPLEALIARLYADVLVLPQVGVDDDFFTLGGHSLLAAQLVARLGRELGRQVPMRIAFERPCVAALASWLRESEPAAEALPSIPRRALSGPAPLSLMQQRVWYLEQLHPGRTVYNVPSAHRLHGVLDRNALERAFAAMVARQASLRTVIRSAAGEPGQHVLPVVDTTLTMHDLSSIDPESRESALAARLAAQIAVAFDLARGPLFRAALYRLDDAHHVLFFMAHHAVWDGWSFDLFYEEMATLYAAFTAGVEPTLAPLAVEYPDFAAWHRGWMDGPQLATQLDHWRSKLEGAPEHLELPTDFSRPPTQSGDGDTAWLRVPDATASKLREIAAREGATVFMILLSAWALLLHRLAGQDEVVVGTPVRGRALPELEKVMGFFVNALPLRLRVAGVLDFASLLRVVRGEVIDAFGHQDVPFEHLVRVVDRRRDSSRFPIYQAFFSYQDARARPARWAQLAHQNLPVFQPAAAQDLALWFLDGATGLVGGLNYNTDILRGESVELIRARYLALLDDIAGDIARPLSSLLRPAAGELAQIAQWNHSGRELPSEASIDGFLLAAMRAAGDRTAVRWGDARVSHGELADRALRVAGALHSRGIGAGDIVGLHLQRTPDLLAALLGVLAAGAAYLPLDPAFPLERLRFMLDDAGARLLLFDADVDALAWPADRSLALAAALATPVETELSPTAGGESCAYVIYTSGSTGKPKGVRVAHRSVLNFLAGMRDRPGLAAEARLAAVTTLSFDIAVLELLLPLAVGASIVLVPREVASDGRALRALIEHERVDTMQATPATWRLLLEAGWRGSSRFTALCGGEALSVDLAEALLARTGALWNMYGPTETTVWSTCARIAAGQGEITIGTPIANTAVRVVDAAGSDVPIGVPGELWIGGAGVALGYHQRPQLTAERFVEDPASEHSRWYRTGDLGRWRSDGLLQHLGRLDEQVKIRGYRIETGEIEAVLARHAVIAQVAVVAAPGPDGAPRLLAYVVGRDGVRPDSAELREYLRTDLPDYMLPAQFIALDDLPLTPNGKVDRRALPAPSSVAAAARELHADAPRSEAELLVGQVWSELLGVARIDRGDNFLDLGGHSLLIMRAVALIEARSGVALGPRGFVFQSLAQVAAELERGIDAKPRAAGVETADPPSWLQRMRALFARRGR